MLSDIGSHLLDLCLFWFNGKIEKLKIIEINRFENKAPDHAILSLEINKIKIELEMSLCMWKNTFTCDCPSTYVNRLTKVTVSNIR